MNFKMLKEGQKWEDLYQYLTFPKDIKNCKESQNFCEEKENLIPKISSIYNQNTTKKENDQSKIQKSKMSSPAKEKLYSSRIKDEILIFKPPKRPSSEKSIIPEKDPYMRLNYGLGFSGKCCPDIKWMKSSNSQKELVYASGSLIVVNNVEKKTHRFLFGHTEPIVCLDVYRDNEFLVSVQDGKKCLIKLWTPKDGICISTIQPPYESIRSISFSSQRKFLCSVGIDHLKRQVIIIWDLENIINKKKVC